jgi:phage terminase small subunit
MSAFMQGYNDALDGRVIIAAYDTDNEYYIGYNQAMKDTKQIEQFINMSEQTASLLNPDFEYNSALKTDVTRTWRKFGWKPLAEKNNEQDS